MEFAVCRLVFFVLLVGMDISVALYNRFSGDQSNKVGAHSLWTLKHVQTSYVAHIGGFISGLLLGIVVLRNFKKKTWERVVWWIALFGYLAFVIGCVLWNLMAKSYPPQEV